MRRVCRAAPRLPSAAALDAQPAPERAAERAAPPTAQPATSVELRFSTPAELRARTPPEPVWLWDGYLAAGAVTLLAGKPKTGKSTLAMAVSIPIATDAASFLGRSVLPGAVVYVSEEGAGTLMHKLPDDDAALQVLTRDCAWPKPEWPALVTAAVAHARKVGAKLLVIDTAAYWTALPADREKDAGAVQAAMLPLVHATRSGLAMLIVHHTRKAGGDDGAVRGSSAWAASVDIIIELERPDKACPNRRQLIAFSRYPQTPAAFLIDHDPTTGSWAALESASSPRDARAASDRAVLLNVLPTGEPGITRQELQRETGLSSRRFHEPMGDLIEAGRVARTGAGRKGDPLRYRMLPTRLRQKRAATVLDRPNFLLQLPLGSSRIRPGP